jgi:hypothetical protein
MPKKIPKKIKRDSSTSLAGLGIASVAARSLSARSATARSVASSVRSSAKSSAKRSSRALQRLEGRSGTFGPSHAMSATAVRLAVEMVDRAEELDVLVRVRAGIAQG